MPKPPVPAEIDACLSRPNPAVGRAAEIAPDPDLADIDRVSRQYTGEPYAGRGQERVSAWVEVSRWYGWAGGEPWTGGG